MVEVQLRNYGKLELETLGFSLQPSGAHEAEASFSFNLCPFLTSASPTSMQARAERIEKSKFWET